MSKGGVLLVDKPKGITSFDVVRRLRRATRIRKWGHAGTLDPMATGLLVLCADDATRWIPYLQDHDKVYTGTIHLGIQTSTDDAEGEVVDEREVGSVSAEDVLAAAAAFIGEIEQRPPAYSAIKIDGQRAYARARRGEELEMPTRLVRVYGFEVLTFASPEITFRAHVSKGTYIRSLARDLGDALGCGAHLTALRRTRSGPQRVSDAVALEELEENKDGSLPWVSAWDALSDLPELAADDMLRTALKHGQRPKVDAAPGVYRVADEGGELYGVVRVEPAGAGHCVRSERLRPLN